jgi:hypothetical protein
MAEISERQLKVLEKLISDEEFRAGFLEDPDTAISRMGIELAEEELAGLRGLDLQLLQSTLTDLDTRLSKSASPSDVATDLLAGLSGLLSLR